ncbi:LOW QUALITY PROTEIN: oligodendrocyte-myelin glycoprotein-like [Lampetra planeri]
MRARCASLCLFLLLLWGLLGGWVLSVCPSACSCSQGHRVVDCSSRGLTKLPHNLQHNIRSLNLSFNRTRTDRLSHYAHLRTLDVSYNRLPSLPPALPRSLWVIRAAGNHLRLLDKNDTAYHWNLRALDLSRNELERVVFINNTLPGLRALNLSHNRFWTVPTNMPHNLERIDLSHNYLVQILPGSLDRLPRLAQFYLHANRFSWLHEGGFDKLSGLAFMTLGENPWACEEEENITRLLRWATQTPATVTGCPCYTRPVCGPADGRRERHSLWLPARTTETASTYEPDAFQTGVYRDRRGENVSGEYVVFVWTSSPGLVTSSTHTSTTKSPKRGNAWKKSHGVVCESGHTLTLLVIMAAFTSL